MPSLGPGSLWGTSLKIAYLPSTFKSLQCKTNTTVSHLISQIWN